MYQVKFTSQAENDLTRIDKSIAQRILKKIRWLAENIEQITPEQLSGPWQGMYKLRIGDYRVIYAIDRGELKVITVHFVGHRREVYKLR